MNNYSIIELSCNKDEAYIEEEDSRKGLLLDLMAGKPLQSDDIYLKLYHTRKEKKLTDLLGSASYFAVTIALKLILEQFESHYLQFFPIEVMTTWNKKFQPYYLVNVLENIHAIDEQASDFERFSNGLGIKRLRKLVLDMDAVQGRNLFRDENIGVEVFVSETLKQAIIEQGLTGINFKSIEDYKMNVF